MSAAATLSPGRLRLDLRRFPAIHYPLRWLNRFARPAMARWVCGILRALVPRSFFFGLPKGCFSELDRIKGEAGVGRIVLKDQGVPALPSPTIILLCGRKQHLEQPWPIFWSWRKNARLIGPSLAHVDDSKRLCVEAAYGSRRVEDDPAYYHFAVGRPVQLEGAWTSIVSKWSSNDRPQPYAHWLLDALPRLALLPEFPAETRIIVSPHQLPYQTQSLKLLGLLDRCRWTAERHLLVEDYFFSAPTSMVVCYNPYAVDFLRRSFLSRAVANPSLPKRFFIRRTSYGRNIANETEVLRFFEDAGWAIVDTAQMSFLEQIELFSGAEAICAIHGSATANMVWCSRGCKVLELFAETYLAGDQEWIAQCVHADYSFLVFPSDHKLDARVDLAAVKWQLKNMGAW